MKNIIIPVATGVAGLLIGAGVFIPGNMSVQADNTRLTHQLAQERRQATNYEDAAVQRLATCADAYSTARGIMKELRTEAAKAADAAYQADTLALQQITDDFTRINDEESAIAVDACGTGDGS